MKENKFTKFVVNNLLVLFMLTGLALFGCKKEFVQHNEELYDRADIIERNIIYIASTLEASDPVFEGVANHPEYDIDEVTDMPNDAPTTSDFWESYDDSLEVMDVSTLDLNTEDARFALRQYYFLADPQNPSEPNYKSGVPVKDYFGDKVSSLEAELALKVEENKSLNSETSSLKEEIKRLTATDAVGAVAASSGPGPQITVVLSPVEKGKVVGVDNSLNFVVVKLTDEAMKELLGEDLSGL